ncbi:TIGR02587 family membrane protein [Agrobacterium sp. ES01]|uniref:TIGR02587 family membrane protein n=1 Tax=Agrobacterium sp. ES01 TaxID=3420714 RepID=UPI003D0E21B9
MAQAQDEPTQGLSDDDREFLIGIARAIGGALLFAIPMLLTSEMWYIGFYVGRGKLLLLLLLNIPLLVVLAHRLGFEKTRTWRQALRDATVAYGIGIFTSIVFLALFGLIKTGMPADEILGKIAIQAVSASIGAMLGRSQLGGTSDNDDEDAEEEDQPERQTGYGIELFMMAVGSLFISFNVAPTEEVILVSYKMTYWHALAMILISLAIMHAFVYALSFQGGHELEPDTPQWHAFIRFTLPGYVVSTVISLYALWTFERLGGSAPLTIVMTVIVLNLPGALGAAAARLIL